MQEGHEKQAGHEEVTAILLKPVSVTLAGHLLNQAITVDFQAVQRHRATIVECVK